MTRILSIGFAVALAAVLLPQGPPTAEAAKKGKTQKVEAGKPGKSPNLKGKQGRSSRGGDVDGRDFLVWQRGY